MSECSDRYKRMPFGPINSGSIFQRAVDSVLDPHSAYCHCYVDDVCIYSNGTAEDHIEKVRKVLQAITKSGLTVSPDKSTSGADSI